MKHLRIFLTPEEQWRLGHGYDPLSEADHAIPTDAQGHAVPACPRCNPEGYAALYARHKGRVELAPVPGPVDQLLTR